MSVQSQIDRISGAVQSALAALTEKGVTVPAGTKVDSLASLIAAIEAGGGGDMNVVSGTFTLASASYSHTIIHDLGVLPQVVIVIGTKFVASNEANNQYVYGAIKVYDDLLFIKSFRNSSTARPNLDVVTSSDANWTFEVTENQIYLSCKSSAGGTYSFKTSAYQYFILG